MSPEIHHFAFAWLIIKVLQGFSKGLKIHGSKFPCSDCIESTEKQSETLWIHGIETDCWSYLPVFKDRKKITKPLAQVTWLSWALTQHKKASPASLPGSDSVEIRPAVYCISLNCVFQLKFSTKTLTRWQKMTLSSFLSFKIILFAQIDMFHTNVQPREQNQYLKLSQLVAQGYWQNHSTDKRHFTSTTHMITERFLGLFVFFKHKCVAGLGSALYSSLHEFEFFLISASL